MKKKKRPLIISKPEYSIVANVWIVTISKEKEFTKKKLFKSKKDAIKFIKDFEKRI